MNRSKLLIASLLFAALSYAQTGLAQSLVYGEYLSNGAENGTGASASASASCKCKHLASLASRKSTSMETTPPIWNRLVTAPVNGRLFAYPRISLSRQDWWPAAERQLLLS